MAANDTASADIADTPTKAGSCYFNADKIADSEPASPYLFGFVVALCLIRLITFEIDRRQLAKYKETKPDPYLADFFTSKEFTDSQKYQHEKHSLSIVQKVYELGIDLNFWLLFFWVWVWNKVDVTMAAWSLCSDTPYINDMKQAYLFLVCATVVEHLYCLPFGIYHTFVVEEKYGFNKTTWRTFVGDEIKKPILGLVMFAILLPAVLWIVEKAGRAMIPALAGIVILGVILL